MKLLVALFATIVPVCVAGLAGAQSARPENPNGFGKATSGNAQNGLTGEFVRDLATKNPPGAVADDVKAARDFFESTPMPPGTRGQTTERASIPAK